MSKVYSDCSKILRECIERKKGLNSFSFSNSAVFALTCEVLKYHAILCEVLESSDVLKSKEGKSMDLYIILVQCYDLLISDKQSIDGGGKIKKYLLSNKARLCSEFARLKIRRKAKNNEDLLPAVVEIAQYARRNRILCSQEQVEEALKEEMNLEEGGVVDARVDWEKIKRSSQHFFRDAHIPDVYVFATGVKLGLSEVVRKGWLIIQQKASCFPAFLAARDNTSMSCCVDACAAPGNKTSHLASLLHGKKDASVWAFEKDKGRMANLQKRMRSAGCQNIVRCVHADFLSTNVSEPSFQRVDTVIVDPSCSGSGIVTRLGIFEDGENEDSGGSDRLKALAVFQVKAVLKAMSFPSVGRVVYSTCSVHEEENEDVVRQVLQNAPDFELIDVFPEWELRGQGQDMGKCVRVDAATHRTIGFFVAVFGRKITSAVDDLREDNKKNKKKRKKKKKSKKIERDDIPVEEESKTKKYKIDELCLCL